MDIVINGQHETGDYTTIEELLKRNSLDPKLVVVELNAQILPAAEFSTTQLKEGDTVEIVQFVAGG